jgi:NAD(P)-dependent dehydrogenase (short-subunit alcohol dehydrogenase family)
MTRLVKDGAEPLRLHLVVADFSHVDEVADLADMLTLSLPALDVLVNNAAVAGPERRTYTGDGHELTFQVNYLATQHPPSRVATGLKLKEAMRCPNGQTRNAAALRRKPTTGNGRRSESEEGHNE